MPCKPIAGGPITVLHVDDDPSFVELADVFLRRLDSNLTIDAASDAEEALKRLEDDSVDCIVSDYNMPGMDGIELLEHVRSRGNDCPFILLTGKGSEEIAGDAISAGVSDYLQKTGNPEQYELLANRIRNLTTKHRGEKYVQQIHEAIDVVTDGISLVNERGDFIYVNATYAEMFGYTPREMLGQHWSILYQDEEEVSYMEHEILATLTEGDQWHGKTRQIHADGHAIAVDHTLAYTSDGMMVCIASETEDTNPQTDSPVLKTV